MVIDSDEKEFPGFKKDLDITKVGDKGFLNSNQFSTSPN
jgi:hypothetical protein